jgi:hypothetical protein
MRSDTFGGRTIATDMLRVRMAALEGYVSGDLDIY